MLMGPEQLTNMLRQPEWSAPVLATALAVSFALGAVHALEPGHGKTLVAAYLVGARGTLRHAMILGGTVTFTHTISVFLLGFATLFLTQYIMPQTIIPVLGVISGLMVIGVGVWLLIKQVRHTNDHDHHHHHDVSMGSLLTLGASGGLVPCPSALVLLLTSISLGHAGKGLLLLVSFSAGLAIVLIGVGAAVVYGKRLLPKHDHHHHHHHHDHVHWLPIVSALVIIAAGIVITATTLHSR
jgi:nickel/cobalt transporter (NicO) family protein